MVENGGVGVSRRIESWEKSPGKAWVLEVGVAEKRAGLLERESVR